MYMKAQESILVPGFMYMRGHLFSSGCASAVPLLAERLDEGVPTSGNYVTSSQQEKRIHPTFGEKPGDAPSKPIGMAESSLCNRRDRPACRRSPEGSGCVSQTSRASFVWVPSCTCMHLKAQRSCTWRYRYGLMTCLHVHEWVAWTLRLSDLCGRPLLATSSGVLLPTFIFFPISLHRLNRMKLATCKAARGVTLWICVACISQLRFQWPHSRLLSVKSLRVKARHSCT